MTLSHQAKGKYPKCSVQEGRDMYTIFYSYFDLKSLKCLKW